MFESVLVSHEQMNKHCERIESDVVVIGEQTFKNLILLTSKTKVEETTPDVISPLKRLDGNAGAPIKDGQIVFGHLERQSFNGLGPSAGPTGPFFCQKALQS